MDFKNKKVAILGFGLEGKDAFVFFEKKGADITIFDRKNRGELDTTGVDVERAKFRLGEDYLKGGFSGFDVVVRSPGVYRYIKEIILAEKNGVLITSPIKIFFENCPAKIIGVTGTKGKGTTTTLIYEILKKAGFKVFLAGNIGKPYLKFLPKLTEKSFVVMEVSSFQLIDLEASPYISVVLNITVDHLDWHKDREEYVMSKENIVKYQKESDFAVISEEYETPKGFSKQTDAKVVFFSKKTLEKKYRENLLLRGEHNLENIAAAVSVAKILKIDDRKILEVLGSFKGLEHRLELVKTIKGVTFYNDSFATGPQPTIAGVNSFSEPETVILGGYDKGLDYGELGKVIAGKKNVRNVILIGNLADKIGRELERAKFKGNIVKLGKSQMNQIVKKAFSITPKGGVVLLSPAAASFDMFKDYKERGNKFKDAVNLLTE